MQRAGMKWKSEGKKFNDDSLRSAKNQRSGLFRSYSSAQYDEHQSNSIFRYNIVLTFILGLVCMNSLSLQEWKNEDFPSTASSVFRVGVLSSVFVFARNYIRWMLCSAERYDARDSTTLI